MDEILPCGELLLSLIRTQSFGEKLRIHIKDNNSPHGKFHRFLFPFSSKFSDLNFASYVLSPSYVAWHTQCAWVPCDETFPTCT